MPKSTPPNRMNTVDLEEPSTAAAATVVASNLSPSLTIPPRVLWEPKDRKYTDKWWGLVYALAYVAFLGCGITIAMNAHVRYETVDGGDNDNNDFFDTTYVSKHFQPAVIECCQSAAAKNTVTDVYDLCDELPPNLVVEGIEGLRRNLAETGNSTFHGDEGIFDAFLTAPEILFGILGLVFTVAVIWVILLRFLAKPVVIATELVKIGLFVYAGIAAQETGTRILCFVIVAGLVAYDVWAWKQILFAADIISHSVVAFKHNPVMFVALLLIQVLFLGNAILFVYFFSQAFDVAQVSQVEVCPGGTSDASFFNSEFNVLTDTCYHQCVFTYPGYVQGASVYLSLAYLWTIFLFHKMRLSVIATIVGSWHFHPENKPSIWVALRNTCTTSFGTLSVSALISTVAEKLNRMAQEPCWYAWLSPAFCVMGPVSLLLCCFSSCLSLIIKMLTKFAVILHVWTGLPFVGSAKKVFEIMSRHFKGGFVTEWTSQSVLKLASYAFSLCIAMLTWLWMDHRFRTDTFPGGVDAAFRIVFLLSLFFTVWYPVLGIYLILLINRFLTQLGYQHYWVSPLAALFVGCLSMMLFTFLSAIFLDTIDTLFLCFAVDMDNGEIRDAELEKLVTKLPAYEPKPASADQRTVSSGSAPTPSAPTVY